MAVFGASAVVEGSPAYERAAACGRQLAEAGFGVITGGYGGVMEAASRGAHSAGGRVVGVTVPSVFVTRRGPNDFVGEEVKAASLTERLHVLMDRSVAQILLEPSLGTLNELLVAWTRRSVSPIDPGPVVTVGARWDATVDSLAADFGADRTLVTNVETVDDAVSLATSHLAS